MNYKPLRKRQRIERYGLSIYNKDNHFTGGSISAPTPSSLLTGLLAFWKLDEAAGQRNDSVGTNHLTDNNTVTQVAGKVGNGAQFTAANSESLSIADNEDLSMGNLQDFTIAIWAYLDSKPANQMFIVGKSSVGGGRDYDIIWENTTDRFQFRVGSAFTTISANSFGAPAIGTWYLIIAKYNSATNTISIQINNGAVDSVGGATPEDGASPFYLGSYDGGSAVFWNGRLDACGIWNRLLSADEGTEYYNAGNGVEHPF